MKIKKKLQQHDCKKTQIKDNKKVTNPTKKKSPSKLRTKQTNPYKLSQISSLESNYLSSYSNKNSNIYYGKKYREQQPQYKRIIDSNQSSTHCSINNRSLKQKSFQNKKSFKNNKSLKPLKNQFEHNQQIEQEETEIKLNKNQVMQLINNYAIKIQRQWRRYWLRKCLRFIILKQRERMKFKMLNQFYENENDQMGKQKSKRSNNHNAKRYSQNFQQKNRHKVSFQLQNKESSKRYTLPRLQKKINQYDLNDDESSIQRQPYQSSIKRQISDTQQILSSQAGVSFNNKKYFSSSVSQLNSKSLIPTSNRQLNISSKSKKNQNHERTSSLGDNLQKNQIQTKDKRKNENIKIQRVDIGLNCSILSEYEEKNNKQLRTPITPINQLNFTQQTQNKCSEKKSNIKLQTKVFQCTITEESRKKQDKSVITSKEILFDDKLSTPKQKIRSNQNRLKKEIPSYENSKYQRLKQQRSQQPKSARGYDIKYTPVQIQRGAHPIENMTRIFKKCKRAIKAQSCKNIKNLQKRYEQKIITERTYKKLLKQTNDKYSTEIKSLQLKQGSFKNGWNELYVMFKQYVKQNSFQNASQIQNKNQNHTIVFRQQDSISLDKWDFQSSAKKSISQLQSFQEFAKQLNERNPEKVKGFYFQHRKNNSDTKTIQLVLDELDKLQSNSIVFQKGKLKQFASQIQPEQNRAQQQAEGHLQILQQFKQRKQKNNYFSKKNDYQLVQSINSKKQFIDNEQFLQKNQVKNPKKQLIEIEQFQASISKQQKTIKQGLKEKKQIKPLQPKKYIQEQKYQSSASQQQICLTVLPTKQQPQKTNKQIQIINKQIQFPQIYPPSIQSLQQIRFIPQQANIQAPQHNHIVTEQSQNDSQVQIKITSINVDNDDNIGSGDRISFDKRITGDKWFDRNSKNQKESNFFESISIKFVKTDQNVQTQQENAKKQQQIKSKQLNKQALQFIKQISITKLKNITLQKLPFIIKQVSQVLKLVHKEKQYKRQLQQRQLRRYPPTIQPTIDNINNWLLQISHHLLDHHNLQIKNNIVHVKQISHQQMLEISKDQSKAYNFYQSHSYQTVSQKIFKQFQFFYIKSVANNLEIQEIHVNTFQFLIYAFHRNLIDSLNITLLDQLSIGKNWVVLPWINSFRYKKKQNFQHSKQCLQRAINRVSSWGEYSMGQLTPAQQINQFDWKQYQQQKMNLVVREQVLQYSIQNDFFLTNLIFKICESIYSDEMQSAAGQIQQIFNK